MADGELDLSRWTDEELRAWIDARLQDRYLAGERQPLRDSLPLWTELAAVLDQACRPKVSGLDEAEAERFRRVAGDAIAASLARPETPEADLLRALQVVFRGCEMAGLRQEINFRVGPPLLTLLQDRVEGKAEANLDLLRAGLAAAWVIGLPLPPSKLERLLQLDSVAPWAIPSLGWDSDSKRHPREVAGILRRTAEAPEAEADLLLWTHASLPEQNRERLRWRFEFEDAARGLGIARSRVLRWLGDLGLIEPWSSEALPKTQAPRINYTNLGVSLLDEPLPKAA